MSEGTVRRLLQKGYVLVELAIVVGIVAIAAAIAVPNFIRFQARSKQSEARMNLKAIYSAQRAFFQEKKYFSQWTGEIGFDPERNNRYAYFLSPMMLLQDRSTTLIDHNRTTYTGIQVDSLKYGSTSAQYYALETPCGTAPVAVDAFQYGSGMSPRFVAVAQGNIDADPTLDEWSISSERRVFKASGNCTADGDNPAGEPANDQNDVVL
jgi:type IV pilus assembly protein PilA